MAIVLTFTMAAAASHTVGNAPGMTAPFPPTFHSCDVRWAHRNGNARRLELDDDGSLQTSPAIQQPTISLSRRALSSVECSSTKNWQVEDAVHFCARKTFPDLDTPFDHAVQAPEPEDHGTRDAQGAEHQGHHQAEGKRQQTHQGGE